MLNLGASVGESESKERENEGNFTISTPRVYRTSQSVLLRQRKIAFKVNGMQ